MDFSIVLVAFFAICAGLLAGFLPGMPAWVVPFFILPFVNFLSVDSIIVFWLVSLITSQFFSSVASVVFGIPGENSTLVYIDYVKNLSLSSKTSLIKQAADASLTSTVLSLLIFIPISSWIITLEFINSTAFRFFVLWWIVIAIVFMFKKTILSAVALLATGIIISGHTSVALPTWVLSYQYWFYDITVINLLVGLILIPMATGIKQSTNTITQVRTAQQASFLKSTLHGTAVGLCSGCLAGPTATIASVLAWNTNPIKTLNDRVISAEAASNSVIIVGGLFFLILQVPLSLDAITVYEVLIRHGGSYTVNNLLSTTTMSLLIVSSIIVWLLIRFGSGSYQLLCSKINHRLTLTAIIAFLIWLDYYISFGSLRIINYGIWLLFFSILGIILTKKNISTIPMLLGFVLGGQLVWTTFQFITSI